MRHLVTIQKIEEIQPIPTADNIEKCRIKGWWVVIKKGEFKVEDKVLYYEIDSFLPVKPEYEFLLRGSKPKKMLVDGTEKEGIRLRTVKLRKQISQGLVLPVPKELKDLSIGEDVTEKLEVVKYEMPISACLAGKVKGSFPAFIPKTDEERIQNMSEVLNQFYVSEKLDGASTTFFKKDEIFGVCSRNLELLKGETTQWKVAEELGLETKLPNDFALQGELIGEGIQKNPYKIKGQKVYFYNAYNIKAGIYLNFKDFVGLCKSLELETVPIIDDNFSLPDTLEEILAYSNGKSVLNPDCEKEGVVVRPKVEMEYNGSRFSFKAISNKYLLNNKI